LETFLALFPEFNFYIVERNFDVRFMSEYLIPTWGSRNRLFVVPEFGRASSKEFKKETSQKNSKLQKNTGKTCKTTIQLKYEKTKTKTPDMDCHIVVFSADSPEFSFDTLRLLTRNDQRPKL
jgi:hypothetical protein